MRKLTTALLAVPAIMLTGCGEKAASPPPPPTVLSQLPPRHCSSLKRGDVQRVSAMPKVEQTDLGRPKGRGVRCATVYYSGSGDLIVGISERGGGAQGLRRLRREKTGELGADSIQALPALGAGAFVARRRFVGFLRDDRVVSLETGYSSQGRLVLTVRQLIELARAVD